MASVENKSSNYHEPPLRKFGVRFEVQNDNIRESITKDNEKRSGNTQPKFRSIKTSLTKRKINRAPSSTDRVPFHITEIQDNQIKRALDDIQERGCTFYKFGFLSHEKKGKKRKTFGDYFNLKQEQMKGLMSIGELWSSKQRSNYLKQNKIYVNKVKLIQKINTFKKQGEFSGRRTGSSNTLASFNHNFQDESSLTTIKTVKTLFSDNSVESRKYDIQKNLTQIKKELTRLHKEKDEKQSMVDMFRKLQKQTQSLDNLQKKYFLKLIDML